MEHGIQDASGTRSGDRRVISKKEYKTPSEAGSLFVLAVQLGGSVRLGQPLTTAVMRYCCAVRL